MFFGREYCTNRPLVACSAINPLFLEGVYGTKTYEAAFGDVSFTGSTANDVPGQRNYTFSSRSSGNISFIKEKANHFLPMSLREAPIW